MPKVKLLFKIEKLCLTNTVHLRIFENWLSKVTKISKVVDNLGKFLKNCHNLVFVGAYLALEHCVLIDKNKLLLSEDLDSKGCNAKQDEL